MQSNVILVSAIMIVDEDVTAKETFIQLLPWRIYSTKLSCTDNSGCSFGCCHLLRIVAVPSTSAAFSDVPAAASIDRRRTVDYYCDCNRTIYIA
jgi:hypothetical protein